MPTYDVSRMICYSTTKFVIYIKVIYIWFFTGGLIVKKTHM